MKRNLISLILVWGFCAVLAIAPTGAFAEYTETEKAALDYLGEQLQEPAAHLMQTGEDVDDIYSELPTMTHADAFPVKFDLRERGVVTPVKEQNPWGTCWSFGTVAASESSLLSTMGLTAAEYEALYGEEMNLSEKHLAYFTCTALPQLSDYPEGEYPYDPGQAGEGAHNIEGVTKSVYELGGNFYLSTSSLASGVGILKDKYAPYQSKEGTLLKSDDWTLPEEERFGESFELKDANVLPSPIVWTENGECVYRPAGTEAIKSELLKGRGVGISFLADHAKPIPTPEDIRAALEPALAPVTTMTDEEKEEYINARAGVTDLTTLSREELEHLLILRARTNEMPDDVYDLSTLDMDQMRMLINARYYGAPIEDVIAEENRETHMSFIGTDPVIWAQYTPGIKSSNHAVCVVGWDDTFPASSFKEGAQPPADGAWIVKNSWGENWGNDGYFYLSYYESTLCGIQSFEYVNNSDIINLDHFEILQYDYMPAEIISSTLFDAPVYSSAIFEVKDDSVLQHISAMTGDLDTTVTATVYLLNENATAPTDGKLLESVTNTFTYAGYHRMTLPTNLVLPAGSSIGITILERVDTAEGQKYALVNTASLGEKAPEAFAELHKGEKDKELLRYCTAIVNPGENYISFEDGRWIDWHDAIETFTENGDCAYMAYDNLSIKGYIYPLDEVTNAHVLKNWVPTAGGSAALCTECGYVLERIEEK